MEQIKAVILAGGYGTRISEESHLRPKPMVEIGGKPILWHIMKHLHHYGIKEFIILGGYKQQIIKEYFFNYFLHTSDITFDFTSSDQVQLVHRRNAEKWKVTVVDTGLDTMTGGRIRRVRDYLDKDKPFLLTYGDGVSDVNIYRLIDFHSANGHTATLTGIRPEGRFGVMDFTGDNVKSFREKATADTGWINGGFFILEPEVIDYIDGDATMFEKEPLERIAADGQLDCYRHNGFWKCMDTLRDKEALEKMWADGNAPWKVW